MTQPVVHLELQSASRRRIWSRSALSTAVVAASFVLTVSTIMIASFLREQAENPLTTGRLTLLKEQLLRDPENEQLKEQIRHVDLEVRRHFFQRRQFLSRGGQLLLVGAILLLIAAKTAAHLHSQPYIPDPNRRAEVETPRARAISRAAIAASALAMAGVLIGMASLPRYRPPTLATTPHIPNADTFPTAATEAELTPEQFAQNWPAFRGPTGAGLAAGEGYPTSWEGTSGNGLVWKTEIPLPGNSSPIVWGDRIFLSGATEDQREVYCFDAGTGSLLWRQPVGVASRAAPKVLDDTGYAAPTLATDGHRVFALFATGDLACFDFAGRALWSRHLGTPTNSYGHASSLLTHGGRVIVQYDQAPVEKVHRSALIAFDAKSGQQLWRTDRQVRDSWSSPIVAHAPAGPQIITCADPWVIAYDPESGAEIWRAKGLSGDVAPSPVFAGEILFACNDGADLLAIRTDGRGDVTASHILWKYPDCLPDIVSPLTDGKRVFMVTTDGLVTCCDAATGELLWEHELTGHFHASPVLVGQQIYLLDTDGIMHIFGADGEFREIAAPELGEPTSASPAFASGRIFIRGQEHLYCIGGGL